MESMFILFSGCKLVFLEMFIKFAVSWPVIDKAYLVTKKPYYEKLEAFVYDFSDGCCSGNVGLG